MLLCLTVFVLACIGSICVVAGQGLLTRDPLTRLGTVRDAEEVMEHPFFAGLDWHAILQRRAKPPFSPEILANTTDTRFFDEQFTTMPVLCTGGGGTSQAMCLAMVKPSPVLTR